MFKEILTYVLLLLFPKEEIYIKDYSINTTHIPEYIYWIDDINILLSSYGNTQIYNILSRKSNSINTCKECLYGYDKGFVYCKYEHREIHSMEEFSTTISLFDVNNKLLYKKDLFPTLIPTICTKRYILLKTAYSFLEKKGYLIDVNKDSIREIEMSDKKDFPIKILDEYITFSPSKNLKRVILLDTYYRLWVYMRD